MTDAIIAVALGVTAVIHLLPLVGALSRRHVQDLYDVQVEGADLEILMRHRAVLFGGIGGLLIWAIIEPALQPAAVAVVSLSVVSFLVIARRVKSRQGAYNKAIRRVVIADWIALACLLVAAGMRFGGS